MAEYIEREAVNNICLKHYNESFDDIPAHEALYAVADDINKISAADVVEVVRCKDCRMFVDNKSALTTYCTRECKNLNVKPDDFCSYGERRCEDG